LVLRLGVLLLSSAVVIAGCGREDETESEGAGAQGARAQGPVEASLPPLKPGRWRTTTHVEGSNQHPPPTSACITDETQKANVAMAERLGSLSCSERWVRREGQAIVSHAVCQVDGVTQTFDTRATGDFSTDFFINSVVKRDPPLDGQAEYRTTIHSRWMGDC
jgi:hypothetical protein